MPVPYEWIVRVDCGHEVREDESPPPAPGIYDARLTVTLKLGTKTWSRTKKTSTSGLVAWDDNTTIVVPTDGASNLITGTLKVSRDGYYSCQVKAKLDTVVGGRDEPLARRKLTPKTFYLFRRDPD
jgi:hypothetical protein